MPQGRFVSFEGIEGCGKTTQIALLSEYLIKHSIGHTITREPGGTAVGEGIRKILLNSETIHLTAASELLLFYASRSQNIQEKIKPALERNEIVICDRYYHASMAYQGYGRGITLISHRGIIIPVADNDLIPYLRPVLSCLDGLSRLWPGHSARFHSQANRSGLRSLSTGSDFSPRYRAGDRTRPRPRAQSRSNRKRRPLRGGRPGILQPRSRGLP